MDSYLGTNAKGQTTSFVGPDATNLFRAMTLRGAIDLYSKTRLVPSRGVTISKMLRMATEYSGTVYKRGDATRASHDLTVWIEAMKSAMPIVDETKGEK